MTETSPPQAEVSIAARVGGSVKRGLPLARTIAGLGVWLSVCAGCRHPGQVYHPPAAIDPAQPRESAISFPPYVVEPNDQLAVAIRSPGLGLAPGLELSSSTISVRSDGVVDLDQYGEMPVTGWTIPQIEDAVRERVIEVALSKGKTNANADVKDIEVTVRLLASLSKFYYVTGAVRDEGRVPLAGPTTVLDAILNAGLLSYSLPNEAYLARPLPDGCSGRILRIDWDAITKRGETQTNYQVFPGDRIVVPGGKQPGLVSTLFGQKPTR